MNVKEIFLGIHLEPLPGGGFLATSEELPSLVAQGQTAAESLEIAQDIARKLIESYLEHGDELPPRSQVAASASGEVRIPVSVS